MNIPQVPGSPHFYDPRPMASGHSSSNPNQAYWLTAGNYPPLFGLLGNSPISRTAI